MPTPTPTLRPAALMGTFPFNGTRAPTLVVPVSSARGWSAVSFHPPRAASGTWVLGAPEVVCPENGTSADEVLAKARCLASEGLRTLVLAYAQDVMPVGGTDDDVHLPQGLTTATLLTFREKVRPDAAQTLSYFRQQGVSVKILSGDDHRTVTTVAHEVGIDVGEGYDARYLPPDANLVEEHWTVFACLAASRPTRKRTWCCASENGAHRRHDRRWRQ